MFKFKINKTLLKYFFSYFIILLILIFSFLGILQNRLSSVLISHEEEILRGNLNNAADTFSGMIDSIHYADSMLAKNVDLLLARYYKEKYASSLLTQEIEKYTLSNNYVDSVAYIDQKNDTFYVYGKSYYMTYKNKVVTITSTGEGTALFQPDQYAGSNINQLIHISEKNIDVLIYMPGRTAQKNYLTFYLISPNEMKLLLKSLLSENVLYASFNDSEGKTIFSTSKLDDSILTKCDSKFESKPLFSGFTFSTLTTNEFATQHINEALRSCLFGIIVISVIGLILVIIATGFTYAPIHKLAKKVTDEDITTGNVISNLDIYMTDGLKKNALLEEKVTKYRSQMQQAILISLISNVDDPEMQKDVDLDSFFNPDTDNLITLIRVYAKKGEELTDETKESVLDKLAVRFTKGINLVTIASGRRSTTYILNINEPTESDNHKKNETIELVTKTARELGIRIAISNFSPLALDIPSLFVNVDMCDKLIDSVDAGDVLIWDSVKNRINERNEEFPFYPHEMIEQFSTALKDCDIALAEELLDKLQEQIDSTYMNSNASYEYVTKCILIDIISELVNQMNDYGIKIKDYNDIYFEALYFCRSFPYSEKRAEIKTDLISLLNIFIEHTSSAIITAQSLRIFVEQNYADPNFSITYLADKYNVSIANMSYLFKKELGVNFSNYLWDIRYKKANELLADGKNTVNKVAEAVGYLNVSSFRRKYKSETGHLPSEQRQ